MDFVDVTLGKREIKKEKQIAKKAPYDWRYENSINVGKEKLDLKEQDVKYEKWRTNSSMSNHLDTVLFANETNLLFNMTDQMHYDYLFHSVRKKKRFGKKKTAEDIRLENEAKEENDKILLIQEFYKYSYTKARAALNVLNDKQIKIIKKKLEKGGVK